MEGWGLGQTLPDIPRIYTALAEWLACVICILGTKRRLSGWKFGGIAVAALVIQSCFLVVTAELDGALWMVCMAAAVFLMYIFICIGCDTDKVSAGYHCVHAFVLAEFAASLEWQIYCFVIYNNVATGKWVAPLVLILMYGGVYIAVWCIFRYFGIQAQELSVMKRELIFASIIGLSVFLMSNIGFVYSNTPFSGSYSAEIFTIRTLVDLGGLAILYAYYIQSLHLRVQHELKSMEMILYNQYAQYQQSQDALDLINYKYHDLKHHIIALRAEESAEKRNEYLTQMEEDIKEYAVRQNTGNAVLDVLLTSKKLFCVKNSIELTSVVDGKLLDFMDAMDICSVFGNALDNAIECEMKIDEKEKRMVNVSVFSQKAFLIIRIENYCEEKLRFNSDLPMTTKSQAEFHGYGLKSLKHTVHKYGGEVDISVADNWFSLKILIPM